MKRSNPILFVCLVLLPFIACRKHTSNEEFIQDPNYIVPDLSVKVVASVAGYIVDENNQPVFNAQVVAGNKETNTDEYGYFAIGSTSLSKAAGLVKVSRNGYFTAYRTFTVEEGAETFVRMQLLPKTNAGSFDAASGGLVTTADGGKVQLPANSVVTAANGGAYTGTVKVAIQYIDPSAGGNFQLSTPGDDRALDSTGRQQYARSFGVMAVELTGNSGERLQIAPGKQATITIPVAAGSAAAAPDKITLWSFDENTGYWKQEATAVKSGNAYVGTVSHFSYWEGATGLSLVNFTARVLDASLQPLVHVPVLITPANMPQYAGYGKFSFTDAQGNVQGAVLANSNLVLQVMTPCATSAYAHPFTTTTNDIDLGAFQGNLGQSVVTISGTAVNCSNGPVTDGYVQTYDNGFYNRIPISNGSFSFTGLACTNTTVHYIVVDNTTNQQNTPQSITLTPGVNSLGQLSACGLSSIGSISYTIDGVTTVVTGPGLKYTGYYLAPVATWTQILVMDGGQNATQDMSFQFDGGTVVGDSHHVTDIFSVGFPSKRGYAPVPLKVTITEFGKPGGFITGSFGGLVLDFNSNSQHNMSCSFRVRRFQ